MTSGPDFGTSGTYSCITALCLSICLFGVEVGDRMYISVMNERMRNMTRRDRRKVVRVGRGGGVDGFVNIGVWVGSIFCSVEWNGKGIVGWWRMAEVRNCEFGSLRVF